MSAPRAALLVVALVHTSTGFSTCSLRSAVATVRPSIAASRLPPPRADASKYTEVQRLRAEAESPFAQIRLFALPVLFAAAGIATYFAATGLLASTVGVRDPSPTGVQDLLIDLGSMGATGYLWRREVQSREARLKRIAFGSQLAALRISPLRVTDAAAAALESGSTVSLSDLRRGRGQARRVVLVCAPEARLAESLKAACALAAPLAATDHLIVPLVVSGTANSPALAPPPLALLQQAAVGAPSAALASVPAASGAVSRRTETQPALPWDEAVTDVALGWPVALAASDGAAWTDALKSELAQAASQDAGVMERGLTISLKKNGRVAARRLGTPEWRGLVAEVEGRRNAGMDVVNM